MQQPNKIRIILSGGGTGGHIFPAVAIANAIKLQAAGAEILFVGAKGRMEMEKVPAAGFAIKGLTISGFQRKLSLKNLTVPLKLLASLLQATQIIKSFKPDLVIGTGGYASGPTLRMASWFGIPTLIQEQNSFPGVTNKMLAGKARLICVAYPGMEKYFPAAKIRETGNPVRAEIENLAAEKSASLAHFGLQPGLTTVLVVGGSLGARTINQSIDKGRKFLSAANLQLIWQTGKSYAETASQSLLQDSTSGVVTKPFITDMAKAYAAADIVVSRAGAIAISELCVLGKPCILIPSPNVAEDHQTKNATALSTRGAALMVSDAEAGEKLIDMILNLASDSTQQHSLKANISKMAHYKAAEKIACMALELIDK